MKAITTPTSGAVNDWGSIQRYAALQVLTIDLFWVRLVQTVTRPVLVKK
jgi:hypothetical protein